MSIADKHKLPVIEDAAQAHGAGFKGKRAGSFGLAAGFSFYPGKNLGAYGEGGAIVTSDDSLAAEIRKLRDHGFAKKYYSELIGFNARMDGFQGAVLAVKLKHLDRWNQMRNRVADMYRQRLKDLPIGLPAEIDGHFQVYHQFVIEVDFRDEMQKYLRDNGVPTLIHYPIPVHKQKAYIDAGYKGWSFPVTERLAGRILSLPVYPELKEEEIDYICSRIREFIEGRAKN